MTESAIKSDHNAALNGGKFLSFFLGSEEYGIEILRVQEIIGLIQITPVPKMPDFIRGIINLRGKIIPIMDLRTRFNLPGVDDTEETCIIVVEDNNRHMGIVVDKVSEVADLRADQMEEVPEIGLTGHNEFLMALGKTNTGVKMIIEISRVVFSEFRELSVGEAV
jgi:purine-binding chemotaxis protein CheW